MRKDRDVVSFGVKELFLESGVFAWRDCLRRSGTHFSPARVIFAIGFCLRAAADESDLKVKQTAGVVGLIEALLGRYQRHIAQSPLPDDVQAWGPQHVDWWRPREHLGDLIAVECGPAMLVNTGRRMRERGIRVDYGELSDLAAVFSNDYLHRAMKTFDPVRGEGREDAWVTTVFFRYATPRVMAMWHSQVAFHEAFPDDGPSSTEDEIDHLSRKAMLDELLEHLDSLPQAQREALHLYFGLQQREHTLQEVAIRLGKSVYFARAAITTGLGALAFRLSPDKWDDPLDASVARLLFTECKSKSRIAEQLQLSRKEVNTRAAKLGALLRQSLRARTVTHTHVKPNHSEQNMSEREISRFGFTTHISTEQLPGWPSSEETTWSLISESAGLVVQTDRLTHDIASLIDVLRKIYRSPDPGFFVASRSDVWLRNARAQAKADPELYGALASELLGRGEEDLLGYFFAPDLGDLELPSRRSDISERQRGWNSVVEESLGALDELAREFLENYESETESSADSPTLLRTLALALPTASITLEEELAWSARARREARLRVWKVRPSDNSADFRAFAYHYAWEEQATSEEPSNFLTVVYQALELASDLDSSVLLPIARHVCEQVISGTLPLPTFTHIGADQDEHTILLWRAPQLQLATL